MGPLIVIFALIMSHAAPACPVYQTPPPDAGAKFFSPIFEACPDYVGDSGAIAYQYGEALDREERPAEAIRMLDNALRVMGEPDPNTIDLFVELVYRERDYSRFDDAAEQYLELLSRIHRDDVPTDLGRRIVDELAPILSTNNREELGMPEGRIDLDALLPGVGEKLVRFWHRADPLAATARNERLSEHLSRVAYVRSHLTTDEGSIDDRAATYLRYGEPRRRDEIRPEVGSAFSAARIHRQGGNAGYLPDLETPRNEIWVYSNIDASIHFVFIQDERTGHYEEGNASDLLPRTWAGSLRRTNDFLHVMEVLYRQLSVNHADYGLLYSDVANYNMALRSGQQQAVAVPPRSFAVSAMSESQNLDYHISQDQRDILPTEHSNIREDVERFPVDTRIARFLTDDGSTRTEIYWGTSVEALYPDRTSRRALRRSGIEEPSDNLRFMLAATGLVQDENYISVDRKIRRFNLGPFGEETGLLSPGPMYLSDIADPFRLSLQWDLFVYDAEGRIGSLLKYQTETIATVEPLDGAAGRFQVSDLKPLVLTGDEIPLDIDTEARIYPFRRLGAEARLGLAFEVYNITPNDDGQYRYTIEYSVVRRSDGEALDAAVRASFETNASSDYSFVLVELADWSASGPIKMLLAFVDETTGASVERSIDFDVSSRL